jgi:hypothetical protein
LINKYKTDFKIEVNKWKKLLIGYFLLLYL